MQTLNLRIRFGNAEMQGPEEAADALREVASKLDEGYTDGPIFDLNGNRVGNYSIEGE